MSSRLSRAVIVVQTNAAHIVHITISLFLTYLLGPISSDMQLFIKAVHAVFFIVGSTLNGTATEHSWIGRNARKIDAHPVENFWLHHCLVTHLGQHSTRDIGVGYNAAVYA